MSRTNDNNTAGAALAREGAGPPWPACPACGGAARRARARYCAACGSSLRECEYRPGDALRASYRWPGGAEVSLLRTGAGARSDGPARNCERLFVAPPAQTRADVRGSARRDQPEREQPDAAVRRARLTSPNRRPHRSRRNAATERAYILIAYALMPYIGIVFCPAAIVCGAVGLRRASREGHPAAEREAEGVIVYAILLTGAQALLWGFIYLVPVWLR